MVVDPWIEGLFPALQSHLGVSSLKSDDDHKFIPNPEIFGNPEMNPESNPDSNPAASSSDSPQDGKSAEKASISDHSQLTTTAAVTLHPKPPSEDMTSSVTCKISKLDITDLSEVEETSPKVKLIEILEENVLLLRSKLQTLKDDTLTLPVCPLRYLKIDIDSEKQVHLYLVSAISPQFMQVLTEIIE